MAYVHPRRSADGIAAIALRQATRFVAIASYTVAVTVAFVLLSPVLPGRGSEAVAVVPAGPQPVVYTLRPGDTLDGIAASQGISLAQLFAMNPDLTPLTDAVGESVVVGLR
jgi:LysM repeat protein